MKTKALLLLLFGFIFNSFAQYAPIKSILEVEGPVNSDIALGTGIIGLGDVNGDGNPDFAVSAWNAKKTYIYYGGKGILDGIADDSIPGGGAIEKGDLNGDGITDLVIKLNGDTSWIDQLAIYLGRKNTAHRYDTIPNVILREEPVNGYLGNSKFGDTFAVGDLNDDGYDDLVVGAPDYDYKGKVYIYFGGKTITNTPSYIGVGATICTQYGFIVKIADINGDRIPDLLISSQQALSCNNDSGYVSKIYIYCGKQNWAFEKDKFNFLFDSRKIKLENIYNFSIADINADGIYDIAFPGDSDKMFFVFGRTDSLSSYPDFYITRDSTDYDNFTYVGPVTNVGDINKDGKEDFVIKAYSSGEYCLHLFLGNEHPQKQRVAVRCKSGVNHAYDAVAALGDVNGDGVNDFGSIAPNNLFPPNDGYFVIFSGDSNYVTSVKDNPLLKPLDFNLQQNYPNPFNPSTTIEYTLQKEDKVELKIFNVLGKEIKTLINKSQQNGNYKVVWDGTDNKGEKVSSGIYFYRLQINNATVTKKAVFIK